MDNQACLDEVAESGLDDPDTGRHREGMAVPELTGIVDRDLGAAQVGETFFEIVPSGHRTFPSSHSALDEQDASLRAQRGEWDGDGRALHPPVEEGGAWGPWRPIETRGSPLYHIG